MTKPPYTLTPIDTVPFLGFGPVFAATAIGMMRPVPNPASAPVRTGRGVRAPSINATAAAAIVLTLPPSSTMAVPDRLRTRLFADLPSRVVTTTAAPSGNWRGNLAPMAGFGMRGCAADSSGNASVSCHEKVSYLIADIDPADVAPGEQCRGRPRQQHGGQEHHNRVREPVPRAPRLRGTGPGTGVFSVGADMRCPAITDRRGHPGIGRSRRGPCWALGGRAGGQRPAVLTRGRDSG